MRAPLHSDSNEDSLKELKELREHSAMTHQEQHKARLEARKKILRKGETARAQYRWRCGSAAAHDSAPAVALLQRPPPAVLRG